MTVILQWSTLYIAVMCQTCWAMAALMTLPNESRYLPCKAFNQTRQFASWPSERAPDCMHKTHLRDGGAALRVACLVLLVQLSDLGLVLSRRLLRRIHRRLLLLQRMWHLLT
jgi:hypothetical protein